MRFKLLGPLTVEDEGGFVALGGVKQRATLGYLLLNANQVVASSTLLRALWTAEERPASARKILHNAVWRLRGTLSIEDKPSAIGLATRSPGYVLTVDPADVDLLRFRDGVAAGRAKLADGAPEAAARLLRGALALWQGPALADLVEEGMHWPGLDALAEERIDAQEDRFDAELACGRHQAVLGELRALVGDRPVRERVCGQLMLALYRCGRQAEALEIYAQTRVALIDELGLEPGQDLQRLQRAILNHDLSLRAPEPPRVPAPVRACPMSVVSVLGAGARQRSEPACHTEQRPDVPAPAKDVRIGWQLDSRSVESCEPSEPIAGLLRPPGRGRQQATVLIVRREPVGGARTDHGDDVLAETAALVRAEVERAGGAVLTAMGSMSLAVFGLLDTGGACSDAERAVRAAIGVRDRLGPASLRSAVVTGPLPLPERAAIVPTSITGVLIDQCQELLAGTSPGEIRVCPVTRSASRSSVAYVEPEPDRWVVRALSPVATEPIPLPDRDTELSLVANMVDLAGRRARPHLVRMLGAEGVGKTCLLAEVRRRHSGVALSADHLPAEHPAVAHALLLSACCGVSADSPLALVRAKLVAVLGEDPEIDDLLRLFDSSPPSTVPAAWWRAMAVLNRDVPMIITADDVHAVGPDLLGLLRALLNPPLPFPLCVVVGGRPDLLDREQAWCRGIAHTATITLAPHGEKAMDRTLCHVTSNMDSSCLARAAAGRSASG